MCQLHLDHIGHLDAMITKLDAQIEAMLAPFRAERDLLSTDGYLKSLFHRHVMKWGGYRSPTAKKKTIIVVAHAMTVIIWDVLAGSVAADLPVEPVRPGPVEIAVLFGGAASAPTVPGACRH